MCFNISLLCRELILHGPIYNKNYIRFKSKLKYASDDDFSIRDKNGDTPYTLAKTENLHEYKLLIEEKDKNWKNKINPYKDIIVKLLELGLKYKDSTSDSIIFSSEKLDTLLVEDASGKVEEIKDNITYLFPSLRDSIEIESSVFQGRTSFQCQLILTFDQAIEIAEISNIQNTTVTENFVSSLRLVKDIAPSIRKYLNIEDALNLSLVNRNSYQDLIRKRKAYYDLDDADFFEANKYCNRLIRGKAQNSDGRISEKKVISK